MYELGSDNSQENRPRLADSDSLRISSQHACAQGSYSGVGYQRERLRVFLGNKPASGNPIDNTADIRQYFLKQFGVSSLAFSFLQERILYFLHPTIGYLPYIKVGAKEETVVCLSDPVCAREQKEALIEELLKRFEDLIFVHIAEDTAKVLQQRGFYVNELASEMLIDVQQCSVEGSKKQFLLSQRQRAENSGLKVREVSHSQDQPGVRKFYALKDNEIVGFVHFDPIYKLGKIEGYLVSQVKSCLKSTYSIVDYIILEALEQFKKEGVKQLSLGFSHFADIQDYNEFKFSKPLKHLFKFLADTSYNFKAPSLRKMRYCSDVLCTQPVKVYCASRSPFPYRALYAIFCKLEPKPMSQLLALLVSGIKKRMLWSSLPVPMAARPLRKNCLAD